MKVGKEKTGIYKIVDYAWVIVAILVFIASIKYLNDGTLGQKVEALGLWGPVVIILLKISTLVFAPLGGFPLYIISGALYGTSNGFLLCFLGDIIGSVICFLLSRIYGFKVINLLAGASNMQKIKKIAGLLNNTRSFLKARIAFASIPELIAYAAGLSSIKFNKFLLLHIPFLIPAVFLFVFLGSSIVQFTAKYTILISLVTFAVASIGIWALSKDYRKIEGM